nr:F-box/FBD/LRR-repeat protein At5g56420-like [Quercus suber]
MDESVLIQEPKRLKLNEEQDIDEDRKNLNNLPEEILRHILSLLLTIDAIRTSMLSKRWENLWTCIPNLDFQQRLHFLNFVERVLLLHVSDIKKFTLYFLVQHDASCVNAWISAAVKHNVQELHIRLSNFQEPFSLPHCLFTCVTLTKLDLTMPCIHKLPPTICFSKLKILILRGVSFSDEHSTQKLFSGFPVHEELCLDDCHWMDLKVVSICAPKLSSLMIQDPYKKRWSDSDGCQVKILGVSLESFYYTGEFFNEYSLHKSALLVEAYINALRYAAELLPHMPMFNNLLDLDFIDGSINLDSIALLKICKNLPILRLWNLGVSLSTACEKVDSIPDPVPPCFLSQLKCIKVGYYNGDEKELSAVKILLKNAVALDSIVISFSKNFAGDLEKRGKQTYSVEPERAIFERFKPRSTASTLFSFAVHISKLHQPKISAFYGI